MRKFTGILCMVLGVSLVFGALWLILNNRQEDQMAREFTHDMMPRIREEIHAAEEVMPEEREPELTEFVPVEYLEPEDLVMTEKTINGYAYIGYLAIGELNLELPVMSGWSSRQLQISPCRYSGTLLGEDLVIMAHNFGSHFGRLSKLSVGSTLQFADMDGKVWDYEVVAMDVLAAEAVEEMTAGEYDLTLFTCAPNRTHRVTVRCDRITG